MTEFQIGDVVKKKSGKPFQNHARLATIAGFVTASVPCANGDPAKRGTWRSFTAVELEGCEDLVELARLEKVEISHG